MIITKARQTGRRSIRPRVVVMTRALAEEVLDMTLPPRGGVLRAGSRMMRLYGDRLQRLSARGLWLDVMALTETQCVRLWLATVERYDPGALEALLRAEERHHAR